MPELEVLRRHYPEPPPSAATDAARRRARSDLLARIDATERSPLRSLTNAFVRRYPDQLFQKSRVV